MTLVEFLYPLRKSSRKDCILSVMYFIKRYEDNDQFTIPIIRAALVKGAVTGAKKINISAALSKSAPYVEGTGGVRGKQTWRLTDSGDKYVRELIGLPHADVEIEHEAGTLEGIAKNIQDPGVRQYVEEALKCLQVGALRATIVFMWSGAISEIQTRLLTKPLADVNSAIQTHDPKARTVKIQGNFAYIKESIQLLAARDLGLVDKSEHAVLEDALNTRNRCGHPGKYSPGIKKVSSVIEDLVGIVF